MAIDLLILCLTRLSVIPATFLTLSVNAYPKVSVVYLEPLTYN